MNKEQSTDPCTEPVHQNNMKTITYILSAAFLMLATVVFSQDNSLDAVEQQGDTVFTPWNQGQSYDPKEMSAFLECIRRTTTETQSMCDLDSFQSNTRPVNVVGFSNVETFFTGKNYLVREELLPTGAIKLHFSKDTKSEGKGLLRVQWAQQINGVVTYYPYSGRELQLYDFEVSAVEKPPLFGDWRPAKVTEIEQISDVLRSNYRIVNMDPNQGRLY